jgi:hypothetical protein
MTLLKQINKPSLLLPYEQMYIQIFRRNNELIHEQHPNERNLMFELLQHTPHAAYQFDNYSVFPSTYQSSLNRCTARPLTEVRQHTNNTHCIFCGFNNLF